MDIPLLATKLFVPRPRPGLVARPRLIERFNDALSHPFVLVAAPAGFGKTTILAQWIAGLTPHRPVAWVSLDEGDNDPVRFWDYMLTAIDRLYPGIGKTASSMLHSGQAYPPEAVLTLLINDIGDINVDFSLFVDDYHVINSELIHVGITFLLEHLPPCMHMIVATRVNPPLPLPRFRGRGTMLEIGVDDLRFTAEEADGLLAQITGRQLSAAHAASLSERTEGWAAGLKMAALSLRGRQDVEAFLESFAGTQRYVMDYLVDEVLKQQRPDVREFLLTTSVLGKLSAPLCDAVTVCSDSRDMLERLESSFGGFIVPLDETRHWYRYHHLFGDLLRHQLEIGRDHEYMSRLHQLASAWYEANGLLDDAIHHSLEAKDLEAAIRMIARVADGLIGRGEWDTLFAWFNAIPEKALRSNPAIYAQYANVLLTRGKLEAAESILAYLERASGAERSLQGRVALFRSIIAYRRGDLKRMPELAQQALDQLPPDSFAERARLNTMLGLYEWGRGALDEAWSRSLEAVETGKHAGDYWIEGCASGMLSQILWLRGRLRQALTVGQEAVESIGESPSVAFTRLVLGYILYERNELEEAAFSSRSSVNLSELGGFAENRIAAYYCLAQALLARKDAGQAEEVMKSGDEAIRHPTVSPMTRAIHLSNRIMLAIHQNDVEAARDWRSQLAKYPPDTQWTWFQHANARLAIALGDQVGAREQLSRLCKVAVQSDAQGYAIRLRVYQALAAPSDDEALAFLADALRAGEPEGFIRTFADEGMLLARLLRKAIAQGITPEYASMLLAIIEAEERQRRTEAGQTRVPTSTGGPLSEREMEVLRLVAQGLSDRQIASKLVISLSTTKTHVHRILEKLNATSRTQAAAQARSINLI